MVMPITMLSAGYQSLLWSIMNLAYRWALLNPDITENVTEASDNKVETPQTGDNSNIALWLTLCIILSCGITLYIFAVKARKMNR